VKTLENMVKYIALEQPGNYSEISDTKREEALSPQQPYFLDYGRTIHVGALGLVAYLHDLFVSVLIMKRTHIEVSFISPDNTISAPDFVIEQYLVSVAFVQKASNEASSDGHDSQYPPREANDTYIQAFTECPTEHDWTKSSR
jgi:hypothetical protein